MMARSGEEAKATVRGRVDAVFYSTPQFSAGRVRTSDGETVSFAGALMVRQHDPVVLHGTWERHPKFGRQLKVTHFEFNQRMGPEGLAHYLANHPDIKGIGPVKAKRIVAAFGEDFDRVIDDEPERVAEVAKLPLEAVKALREEWLRTRTLNASLTWLATFELTHHQMTALIEKFGNAIVTVLKTDPYLLVREVPGFGFKRVDVVAQKMGTPKEHLSRIRAGIVHSVAERLDQGDCWVDYEELIELANALLVMDVGDSRERIEQELDALVAEGTLACVSLGGRFLVAQPKMHQMEQDLAEVFSRKRRANPHFTESVIAERLDGAAARLNDAQRRALLASARHNLVLVSGGAGSGKAQPLDSKVLTPTGWRHMGDLAVGDPVIGSNGHPCTVSGVYPQGEREVFRVTMTDGSSTECCDDHLWLTRSQKDRDKGRPGSAKPLHQIRQALFAKSGKRNHWIPIVEPIEFSGGRELPLHPYALGLLLGDGCFRVPNGCGFSKLDLAVVDALQAVLPDGAHLQYHEGFDYRIIGNGAQGGNPLLNALRELGLAGKGSPEKFVPDAYKLTSAENRLALLQGLLDTDGSTQGHNLEFSSTSRQLAEDVLFLVRSLGGTASFAERQTYYTHNLERRAGLPSFRLYLCLPAQMKPFRSAQKAQAYIPHTKYFPRRAIASVESVGVKSVQCIAVDAADHLYVTDDFIVTHNTFTVAAITKFYEEQGLKVVLAAPTGKAAKRIEQVVGREAFTLHRLLGFNGKAFTLGPDEPIKADVVIVDEVSMVDVPLAWHFFRALDLTRTAVVLVGDHNQLPPVGPGNLLRDLIERQPIPTVVLDQVVRQAGVLKENSIAVLSGDVRRTADAGIDGRPPWIVVNRHSEVLDAQRYILELFDSVLVEKLRFDLLADVQLLTPTRKGPLGVEALNVELQRVVQKKLWGVEVSPPPPGRRPEFLLHDRVIQMRNNYDLGVMNGAIGIVTSVGPKRSELRVRFDDHEVELTPDNKGAQEISLAYALTIHKSQGSEFPCAVLVIHKAHSFMHHRNLFYTGVTRARQVAIIVGDQWGMKNCAEKEQVERRKTFLSVMDLPSAEPERGGKW